MRNESKEIGIIIEKTCGGTPVLKDGIINDILQKRDVRPNPADAELAQGPIHPLTRFPEIHSPSGHFDEQGIVVGRDRRSSVGRGAVESYPESGGGAISMNLTIIRHEVVRGIFCGHATLESEAVPRDVALRRKTHYRAVQCMPLSDQNLRADDVDTGDNFCDRMLHLDARIYLDEAPIAAFDIDEELDGTRVEVFRLARDSHGCSADFVANANVERNSWRHFNDLLMATLDRAVALIEMEDVPVMISKDLNFDVLGSPDIALEENRHHFQTLPPPPAVLRQSWPQIRFR